MIPGLVQPSSDSLSCKPTNDCIIQGSPQSRHCRHFAGWRLALPAQTKIWSLFAGWKVLLVFVFASWRSSCLSKTAQRVGTLSFPFFFLLKQATGRSSSCLKAHFSLEFAVSVRVGQLRDDHESRVDACQITCKWRRMPRGTSGLLSVARFNALHRPCSQLTHVTKKLRANGLCRAKDLARTSILWSFRIEKQELAWLWRLSFRL